MKDKPKRSEPAPSYPRTYRLEGSARIVINGIGVAMLACALQPLFELLKSRSRASFPGLLIGAILCTGAALIIFFLNNQRLTLYEDAIEVQTWFSRRRLKREEIAGYITRAGYRGGIQYTIVPIDQRKRAIRLSPLVRHDKMFFTWLRTVRRIGN